MALCLYGTKPLPETMMTLTCLMQDPHTKSVNGDYDGMGDLATNISMV